MISKQTQTLKRRKTALLHFSILALALGFSRVATAQNATGMAQVRTVFSRRASGNAFFNRNLRAALRARGLRFTTDKKRADALLDTSGQGTKDGGFAGQMTFIGRGGRILKRETIVRAAGSRAMAYQSLARRARFGGR